MPILICLFLPPVPWPTRPFPFHPICRARVGHGCTPRVRCRCISISVLGRIVVVSKSIPIPSLPCGAAATGSCRPNSKRRGAVRSQSQTGGRQSPRFRSSSCLCRVCFFPNVFCAWLLSVWGAQIERRVVNCNEHLVWRAVAVNGE
ncbi:hypothetical protein B0H13DRAFT_1089653 [Mycena leptocephala]|nr:hypothetical protein B0H13DRAFT_1089653 [Mycena leptocephala]